MALPLYLVAVIAHENRLLADNRLFADHPLLADHLMLADHLLLTNNRRSESVRIRRGHSRLL